MIMAKENFIKVEQVIYYIGEETKMHLTLKIFSRNVVSLSSNFFFFYLGSSNALPQIESSRTTGYLII